MRPVTALAAQRARSVSDPASPRLRRAGGTNQTQRRGDTETRRRAGKCLSVLVALVVAALTGCSAGRSPAVATTGPSPIASSLQVVLVVAGNWDATSAVMHCYQRKGPTEAWTLVAGPVPVSIGRTGLAWGRGLAGSPPPFAGPVKKEGDGKAPAGAFELPAAFGYAPAETARDIHLPYLALTPNVIGVDDPKSRYYNQIVDTDLQAKDWDSFETMRRADDLYEWGVLVNHNTSPAQAGAGSCIFMHVWRGEGKPTAGCTAMSKDQMIKLVKWLDSHAKPVLVQLSKDEYYRLSPTWGLPTY